MISGKMKNPADYLTKAREFLAVSSQFRLGALPTEQPHPLTRELSSLAKDDLSQALSILNRIDCDALETVLKKYKLIELLAEKIQATISSGKNIYLCGCGATGRLSLTCETLWRRLHRGTPLENRIRSFMAGGDVALIRSIENFEDHPEFGARQLEDTGFEDGDLLISTTEGGETPFVIGATERASVISSNKPLFMYCNPDEILVKCAERSARVINNHEIEKINLYTGPMALAGSTRMQASTVLMAAEGLALFNFSEPEKIKEEIERLLVYRKNLDCSFLEDLIKKETEYYESGNYLLYETAAPFAITILTDTTERSPTFSMTPFENNYDKSGPASLCYLYIPEAPDSLSAWNALLCRNPRPLNWKDFEKIAGKDRLEGFDFSSQVLMRRSHLLPNALHHKFRIDHTGNKLIFKLENIHKEIDTHSLRDFDVHLNLKMILNAHSTLVMGRLGRYEGNLMTWVRPSNNKLIDRTIRYAGHLLEIKGIHKPYETIAESCFKLMDSTAGDRPLVNAIVKDLSEN
jgi:N-acetylmuramic acid 6-phosphate etherase